MYQVDNLMQIISQNTSPVKGKQKKKKKEKKEK